MDFHRGSGGSPSSSTSSTDINSATTTTYNHPHHHHQNGAAPHHSAASAPTTNNSDVMHSWWESISKARSRIHLLSTLLPEISPVLSSLADSDRPARSLLLSSAAYYALSSSLSHPSSGSGDDPLCQWLYDTFLSGDPDLRLVVLSYVPLLSSLYLSRIHSSSSTSAAVMSSAPSLAGFEAVLLVLYSSEVKARSGKPVLINIPDLSQPSLYHSPRNPSFPMKSSPTSNNPPSRPQVGVLCPPLEPQMAVKSTKRACIVGIALDCYYKQISQMPSWSKIHFCEFTADWAGQDCPCRSDFDDSTVPIADDFVESSNGLSDNNQKGDEVEDFVEEKVRDLKIEGRDEEEIRPNKGVRIPLPWELLQPVLRILGHCLLGPLNSEDVKDAASVAVRCLYARASHDLNPQAILATRSLIQLDKRAREAAAAAAAAAAATSSSNANTPSKAKKPEILLVSK